MKREATALAHPNIALSKYWGKRQGAGNFPAVPSLSVTLSGMATRTHVAFRDDLAADRFVLNGAEVGGEPYARVITLLDRVRGLANVTARAEVTSTNDFPTASGLASSASGFAALALAAVHAAGLDGDATRVSDLARRSSASAARSLFGGYVELPAGAESPVESDLLPARWVAGPEHLPLRVLVCVTTAAAKAVGSTDGMRTTAVKSPYYPTWLVEGPRLHRLLREALLARDFDRVGELAEASALAMHASAMAAGIAYWNGTTLELLAAVRALRAEGTSAYATIDAGPHVKVLVRPEDAARVTARMQALPGVIRVNETAPGEGARIVHDEGAR